MFTKEAAKGAAGEIAGAARGCCDVVAVRWQIRGRIAAAVIVVIIHIRHV